MGVEHPGASEAKGSSACGPEDQGPLASLGDRAGWEQVCSFVTLEALVDLMGAFVPWGHQASAGLGGAKSAGHLGASRVGAGATDANGGSYQVALFGRGGAGKAEVSPEKLGALVGGPEEASAWGLAPSVEAAGIRSPGESGNLVAFGVGADAGVVASDLGTLAGIVEEHQAGGAGSHAGSLAGSGQEAEGWGRPLDQAGTPEAAVALGAEGTVALVAASAAVVGIQEFGWECEWGLLAEAYSGDKPPSEEVRHSQMRLWVEQDAVESEHSWVWEHVWCQRWWLRDGQDQGRPVPAGKQGEEQCGAGN